MLSRQYVRKLVDSEFSKYIVSGVAAVAVDYALLLIITEQFGVHYMISNIGSYMAGLLVSYTLNTRWVFRYRKYEKKTAAEFSIFVLIVLIGLLISESMIYLLVEDFDLPYTSAKLVSVAMIFVFNFLAKKRFLFTRIQE